MNHPTAFTWDGEALVMVPKWPMLAAKRFEGGRDYLLADVEHRSDASHRHEFAWLKSAWLSLPEDMAAAFPTEEHLRKWALIKSGFCTTTDHVCQSRAEALRTMAALERQAESYQIVEVRDTVVRVHKAKSQSRRAMDKTEFQQSKQAVLEIVAAMIGVAPTTLAAQKEAA